MRWWDVERLMPLERDLFPDDAWTAEAYWSELALADRRSYLVAETADGELLGWGGLSCSSRAQGGDAEIMTLAVAPAAQGQGLGRVLLDQLREIAVRRGAGRLLLEVRSDNAAARALYAAAGFEQIGLRADYYTVTVDAIILRLPLPVSLPT
jgi:ribosomal-protein-alanine N-acetyltransferase